MTTTTAAAAVPATNAVDASEISPTTVRTTPAATQADRGFWTLYVGDLDKRVTEPQLVDLFGPFGPILSVRVIRDIVTRASLGYGYVNYQNQADAEKAMKDLNFTELNGRQIRIMWQQRDPSSRYSGHGNLFVKNLPGAVDHKSLHDIFKAFGDILSCKVIKDPDSGQSRHYGFVHFKEESIAKKAIEEMNGKKLTDFPADEAVSDKGLYVANFIKRNARIAALIANFTNIYVKHVLPEVTKEDIEAFFSKFGGISSAVTRTDKRGRVFAFCNFATHDAAVKAITAANEKQVDGLSEETGLYVSRAQSRSERLIELRQMYMQRQAQGNNLYVRNFDPDLTSDQLKDLFAGYGQVSSARIMTDEDGHSRGFGFVSFATAEQANHALKELNGRMLQGKPLVVNIAQRRDQRTSMLQVQFQQRLQALLSRMPLAPFIAGAPPSVTTRPSHHHHAMRAMHNSAHAPHSMTGIKAPSHQSKTAHHARAGRPSASPGAGPTPAPPVPHNKSAPPTPEVTVTVDGKSPLTQPELSPLSLDALLKMDDATRMEALGERLFLKVHEVDPEHAPKITGMFLEMPVAEAHSLLENRALLHAKIREAQEVLAH